MCEPKRRGSGISLRRSLAHIEKTCDNLDTDVGGIWQLIEIGKIGMDHVYPRCSLVVYREEDFPLAEVRIQGEISGVKTCLELSTDFG